MSLPLLHAGRTNPGLSAALDLRFALDKSLTAYRGPTPSFSRASTGSYFDGSGVLRYANVNTILYSEEFGNAYWNAVASSVTQNTINGPTGYATADSLFEASGVNYHGLLPASGVSVNIGQNYTLSVYVKKGNRRYFVIGYGFNAGLGSAVQFDLDTSTVAYSFANGGYGIVSSSATNVGNGWIRISAVLTSTTSTVYPNILNSDSLWTTGNIHQNTYSGDPTKFTYIWGAQLETGSTVGTYCPTTSSANSAPRFNHTYNGTSWVSRGLLVEEQRTNLLINSNTFSSSWTLVRGTIAQDQTGPDGTTSGWTATCNSTGNGHYAYITPGSGASTSGAYTISVFAKKGNNGLISLQMGDTSFANYVISYFDLTAGTANTPSILGNYSAASAKIENVGSGWYRCSLTATKGSINGITASVGFSNDSTAGTCTSGQYNYFYNAQLEFGAFATSTIVTTSAQVTRSADVCQITGGDFSGFWNGTEGTVAVEFEHGPASGDSCLYMVAGGSTDPQSTVFITGGNIESSGYNGSSIYALNFGSWSSSTAKIATGFKTNDFASSLNGGSALTDTSGTLSTAFNRLQIGRIDWGGGAYWNGHIARLRYFNKRLPNATLQLLSEPDPTLNLQFALNKTLTPVAGPAPSFSRASTGSYFDSTGTLKYAGFNLILRSQEIGTSPWSNTDYTITSAIGPDGTSNAQKLVAPASSATRRMEQAVTGTAASYTLSFYAKSAGWNFVQFCSGWSGSDYVNFDLSNGIISNSSGAVGSISSVGNGWYRCSATFSALASTQGVRIIPMATSIASRFPSTTGDGVNGILVFGVQLELGSFATTYAPTTSAANAGPRFDHVYSGGQWVSRGLLIEEQRTNLIQYSEDISYSGWTKTDASVSVNSGIAPDGNMTADKLVENTASSIAHRMYYFLSMGTSSTFSAFFKAAGRNYVMMMIYPGTAKFAYFDILNGSVVSTNAPEITAKVQPVGNGWFRCSVTYSGASSSSFVQIHMSPDGITDTYNGDGTSGMFIWGLQAENNVLFPTSYIPTTTSSATRSADVCQITGTSFGSMWNQGEGAVAVEFDRIYNQTSGEKNAVWFAQNSASPGSITMGQELYNGSEYFLSQADVAFSATPPAAGITGKSATGYRVNDYAFSLNGASALTDTVCTVPTTVDRLVLGNQGGYSVYLNGHIAKLIYYPARLTNTKLQQLST